MTPDIGCVSTIALHVLHMLSYAAHNRTLAMQCTAPQQMHHHPRGGVILRRHRVAPSPVAEVIIASVFAHACTATLVGGSDVFLLTICRSALVRRNNHRRTTYIDPSLH